MKIKIERIGRFTKRSNGTDYIDKNGNPYAIVKVNDVYTAFDSDGWTALWKEGMELDVEVREDMEYRGKKQYTIQKPSGGNSGFKQDIERIDSEISDIKKRLDKLEKKDDIAF